MKKTQLVYEREQTGEQEGIRICSGPGNILKIFPGQSAKQSAEIYRGAVLHFAGKSIPGLAILMAAHITPLLKSSM